MRLILKEKLWIIRFLAIAGIMISSLALYHHYSQTDFEFCSVSQTVSCNLVNKSIYSEIFSIPVALIGIVEYIIVFSVSFIKDKRILPIISLLGFVFSIYLTYIEIAVIEAYCLLCLASLTFITLIFLLSLSRLELDTILDKLMRWNRKVVIKWKTLRK